MTTHHEFDIERATTAADLHVLVDDINANEQLDLQEKNRLLELIAAKFGEWNAQAARANGPVTGRWDPKPARQHYAGCPALDGKPVCTCGSGRTGNL